MTTLEEMRANIALERLLVFYQKERFASPHLKYHCQLALSHLDESEDILFRQKLRSDSALRFAMLLVQQAVSVRQFVETLSPNSLTADEIIRWQDL